LTLLYLLVAGLLLLFAGLVVAIHIGFRPPRERETATPADFGLPFEQQWISGVRGKRLFAWFLPGASGKATVLIQHGWGGNAELLLPLAQPFAAAGYNVLLLDARCHGNSDGDTFASMPRFAEDIHSGVDWLRQRLGRRHPIVLLGHSVGAGAVLLVASRRGDIAAVITLSAFAHPVLMMGRMLQRAPKPLAAFVLAYVQWVIGHRFHDIAPITTICRVHCPVLLVHGTADNTIPHSDTLAISNGCQRKNIELLMVEGADHDSVEKVEEHGGELVDFLGRHGVP
jgi:alpha-beta hydrolase superfamily lysophospholipase